MGLSENGWFSGPQIIDGTREIITLVLPNLMLNQDAIHFFLWFLMIYKVVPPSYKLVYKPNEYYTVTPFKYVKGRPDPEAQEVV